MLRQFLDEAFIDAAMGIEAGDQCIAIDEENVFALDGLLRDSLNNPTNERRLS